MPPAFDNSIVDRIQQSTDIVDLVSEHLSLQRKGKDFVGLCPFHQDNRPSMYVSPAKQIFKCFACGAGGDVFKFVQMRENLSFPEAIERLAARAGIEVKPIRRSRPAGNGQSEEMEVPAKLLARANAWSQKLWQQNLNDEHKGQIARSYVQERQINGDSVEQWGLGFALEGWEFLINAARKAGIADNLLVHGGLAVSRESGGIYDKFRNRLMFPICDVTGRVIGFGGRTLGDDPAKYMNSPATVLFDKSNSLYGLDKARHQIVSTGTAVVVEGYTDVIMCHQFGCKNVVAALGTSFTPGHARILHRYAKRIVLVFDSDVAGEEAANRALEVCLVEKVDIKIAFVSEGKDPCDFLLTAGAEAFEEVVANGRDVMEFKWDRLQDGLQGSDNMTDRRSVVDEFLRSVAAGMQGGKIDAVARGLMISKLSGVIGLSSSEISRELSRIHGRVGRTASYAEKDQRVISVDLGKGFNAKAQQELLEILLNEPRLYEKVRQRVTVEAFNVPILREIAGVVLGTLSDGGGLTLATVLGRIESVEASSAVVKLADIGAEKANFEERLEEALDVLEAQKQDNEIAKFKTLLQDDETDVLRRIGQTIGKKNQRNPGMMAG